MNCVSYVVHCLSAPSFSVFLDHLGIATVDFEFQQDQQAEYGVCESNQTSC